MSKEKQIEEMAVIIEQAKEQAVKNPRQLKTLGQDWFGKWYASALYEAGCRMQSEGEWVKHAASYECTACKEEFSVDGYAEDYDPITDWDLHFCPNCGARMGGGAE